MVFLVSQNSPLILRLFESFIYNWSLLISQHSSHWTFIRKSFWQLSEQPQLWAARAAIISKIDEYPFCNRNGGDGLKVWSSFFIIIHFRWTGKKLIGDFLRKSFNIIPLIFYSWKLNLETWLNCHRYLTKLEWKLKFSRPKINSRRFKLIHFPW